jgi:hypothetical protein
MYRTILVGYDGAEGGRARARSDASRSGWRRHRGVRASHQRAGRSDSTRNRTRRCRPPDHRDAAVHMPWSGEPFAAPIATGGEVLQQRHESFRRVQTEAERGRDGIHLLVMGPRSLRSDPKEPAAAETTTVA